MTTAVAQQTEVQQIEIARLRESKNNPRTTFDKDRLQELAESIEEHGILNPLIVRKHPGDHVRLASDADTNVYEIVCGSRRFRAAQHLKLETVPCIVRALTDAEAEELQIVENLQREEVHALEEATAYMDLKTKYGYAVGQIASRVCKGPAYVQQRLQLVNLIEPAKKLFRERTIGISHAVLIARLQPDQQKECLDDLRNDISVQGLKSAIERQFFLELSKAPFDTKDAKLVPKAGSCVDCPKRTGSNKLLFPDIKQADTCTDPACFANKTQAFVKIQVGTHPKATLLTIGSEYSNGKAKGITGWVKAGDKNCPDTTEGLVVEQLAHYASENQNVKLGTVLKVCTNPKCKTHHEVYTNRSSGQSDWSKKQAAKMKVRKIELRRRALIFKELASEPFDVRDADCYKILCWQAQTLGHDNAKALCDAMGWEVPKAKYGGADYHGTVQAKVSKLAGRKALDQWIYLLMLADSDLWYGTGMTRKPDSLEAKAKANGLKLADFAKLSKQKPLKLKPTTKPAKKKAVANEKETAA